MTVQLASEIPSSSISSNAANSLQRASIDCKHSRIRIRRDLLVRLSQTDRLEGAYILLKACYYKNCNYDNNLLLLLMALFIELVVRIYKFTAGRKYIKSNEPSERLSLGA